MPVKRTRLAARRKAVGFSQDKLAERLQVDRSTIVRWENGDSVPQPWKRVEFAKALRVSVDQLDELLTEESPATADADVRARFDTILADETERIGTRQDMTISAPSASSEKRLCAGCGLPLSRYNSGALCQSCMNGRKNEQSAESGEVLIDRSKLAELVEMAIKDEDSARDRFPRRQINQSPKLPGLELESSSETAAWEISELVERLKRSEIGATKIELLTEPDAGRRE